MSKTLDGFLTSKMTIYFTNQNTFESVKGEVTNNYIRAKGVNQDCPGQTGVQD